MLSELSIKNFAIIDDLTIRFSEGLTIFSGETGAGKSIIINAVNLLLGSRASARMIRTGAESAELSALFYLPEKSPAREMLAEYGCRESGELLVKRVISANNRHRVYINDRLSTMQTLAAATSDLASISGQHEHQLLLKESRHLLVLDSFAGLTGLRAKVYRLYHEILPLLQKLQDLKKSRESQNEHIELLKFQKKEIEDAAVSPGEDEELREELSRLKNAEELYRIVCSSTEALYSSDGAVAERLAEIGKSLEKASGIDKTLVPQKEALEDAAVRIEDLAHELRTYAGRISFDEQRLEEVQERLDTLTRLKRKYGGSLEAVLEQHKKIDKELNGLENLSEEISEAEKRLKTLHKEISESCRELSEKRRQAADALAEKIERELASLKMTNTRFSVHIEQAAAEKGRDPHLCDGEACIAETGTERAGFMISPNPGEDLKPLSEIASGGELSRVVLAVKAVMADSDTPATLIFDEVDAGIGGEVAEMVGRKLSELSGLHQVICITHLAQIAKFGRCHYLISKKTEESSTRTLIKELAWEDRVEETARMIGGADITPTTLEHAKEMLSGGKREHSIV